MATVRYTGNAITRAQVTTLTVGSSTAGHTFVLTLNTKQVSYTAVGGDTTATIAAAIYALLAAREEPDFAEITFAYTASGSTITCTGPDDGTPFTLALSGTGTYSQATTSGTPSSPYSAAIAANYSGNALPSNGDTLVFEGSAVDVRDGLTALAGISLTVVRRATYTGRIGRPDWNPAGYPEYRATHLQLKTAAPVWEASPSDGAGQFRVEFVTTSPTLTVVGPASGVEPGGESLECKAFPAGSFVQAAGGSVAVCPLAGQTGGLDGLVAVGSTVTIGAGVTLGQAVTIDGGRARIEAGLALGLVVDGGADVAVGRAAGVDTSLDVRDGTLSWLSTGVINVAYSIGSKGVFDANAAPADVSVFPALAVTMTAGAAYRDRFGRLGGYTLTPSGCTLADLTIDVGPGATVRV